MKPTIEFSLRTEELKTLLLFAAKNDGRYHLNGILVYASSKGLRLFASDGHTAALFTGAGDVSVKGHEGLVRLTLPHHVFAIAEKAKNTRVIVTIEGDVKDIEDVSVTVKTVGESTTTNPVKVVIPKVDYLRIIPKKVNDLPAQLNPAYIARAAKATALFSKTKTLRIYHNSTTEAVQGCCVVDIGRPDFCIVIAPLTEKADDPERVYKPNPAWFDTLEDEPKVTTTKDETQEVCDLV